MFGRVGKLKTKVNKKVCCNGDNADVHDDSREAMMMMIRECPKERNDN